MAARAASAGGALLLLLANAATGFALVQGHRSLYQWHSGRRGSGRRAQACKMYAYREETEDARGRLSSALELGDGSADSIRDALLDCNPGALRPLVGSELAPRVVRRK